MAYTAFHDDVGQIVLAKGETRTPNKFLPRALFIAVLTAALGVPARAESLQTAGDQLVIGIVVVAAVVVLAAVVIVRHQIKRSRVTGCVGSGANGTIADEKNSQTYTLTGDPAGIKAHDRMTLEGKRRKGSGQTFVFEVHGVIRDFGACQP